jgi:hypothetical protein
MNFKVKYYVLILILSIFFINLNIHSDQIDDWTKKYDKILKTYVKQGQLKGISLNLVDYKSIRENTEIKKLVEELSKLPSIKKYSKNKQLAFWINAYNFLTIVKIIDNPGLKSIKNLSKPFSNVWQQDAGIINNENITLDQIEHKIIRKDFNEPRIHFAVNCASISCPDLRAEAYSPERLDAQLEDQLIKTLDNQKKGMFIDHRKKTIYLSKIFGWYSSDFSNNVKLWLKNKNLIDDNVFKNYSVKYLKYDWDLNSIQGRN